MYNCGKVCLSLLGTWQGDAGETWDARTSTLYMVLVSIQSLILVPQPYFNEPGYESTMGTAEGNDRSAEYNDSTRLNCARFAMLEMLRSPPLGFEEVVRTHFRLRREFIKEQLASWVAESGKVGGQMAKVQEDILGELGKL